MTDTRGQNTRFTCASACQNKEWAVNLLNGITLSGI
jgi:hypothetical protein